MRHVYYFLAALLAVTLLSCERESEELYPNHEAQGLSLSEAKQHFELHVAHNSESTSEHSRHRTGRQMLPKEPEWGRAYTKDLPTGRAVVVPLTLPQGLSYKLTEGRYEPLHGKSYMLMYRGSDGITHAEVVTRMPDLDYLNSTEKNKRFSGVVLVEDWEGGLIKGFEVGKNKVRPLLSLSGVTKITNKAEVTRDGLSATATSSAVWCETITWYSCAYAGGEEYCHEMYSETTCWGSWDEGSVGGPNTDESHYWEEDGGSGGGYSPPAPVVEVIVDQSITENPITNCIYGKLGPGNHGYDNFLAEFQKSTKYNVTFKLAPSLTVGGAAVNGYTDYKTGSTDVTIFINSSELHRPSWEVAGTFIHEMAHAYLAQKLISIGGPGNLKQYATDTEFKNLFDYYAKYVSPETGQYTPAQNSAAHHNLMADKLIIDIAEGIRDYVEANTPGIRNYSDITLDTYKAVAWNGLRDTDAFINLTKQQQDAILAQVRLLQQSTINGCN